jgi:hypothetical protein
LAGRFYLGPAGRYSSKELLAQCLLADGREGIWIPCSTRLVADVVVIESVSAHQRSQSGVGQLTPVAESAPVARCPPPRPRRSRWLVERSGALVGTRCSRQQSSGTETSRLRYAAQIE